jgi:hypothetical protein
MTRKTGQILNGILLVSGLIHMSGLLNNWDYDIYVGLFFTITSGLWFMVDFLKNGKTFSTKNNLVIETRQIKWWRVKEVLGIVTLFFLLAYTGRQMDSIFITLIIYFSLMVILDHRGVLEITDKYVLDNGIKIKFESKDSVDFKQNQIIIKDMNDLTMERSINLQTIDPEDRELIKKRLMKGDATAANSVHVP